jgi:hypothetical protein
MMVDIGINKTIKYLDKILKIYIITLNLKF